MSQTADNSSPRNTEAIGNFLREMLQSLFPGQSILQDACGISDASLEALYEKAYDHYNAGAGLEAAGNAANIVA